jgi:hypothetical protein
VEKLQLEGLVSKSQLKAGEMLVYLLARLLAHLEEYWLGLVDLSAENLLLSV